MSTPLTLDEFVFDQLKSLEEFEKSWRERNAQDSSLYPDTLPEGDWLEQLAFWREQYIKDEHA